MASSAIGDPEARRCQGCFDPGDTGNPLVHACPGALENNWESHWFHTSCLRDMFIAASLDEARMPPTCCGPIPTSTGHAFLSEVEIAAFKEKEEEKATANRIYCPVQTCSAYISKHVIDKAINERVKMLQGQKRRRRAMIMGTFICPSCHAAVCLLCKQLEHADTECPEVGNNHGLDERVMEELGVLRCPHCGLGVSREKDCHHLVCRCGTQWCVICGCLVADCRCRLHIS